MKLLLSIDVEDWFHVENMKGAIAKESWSQQTYRLEKNMDWLLKVLSETDTLATFFVLGWVAERSPTLVQRIWSEGHEVASHGHGHDLIYHLSPEAISRRRHEVEAFSRGPDRCAGLGIPGT